MFKGNFKAKAVILTERISQKRQKINKVRDKKDENTEVSQELILNKERKEKHFKESYVVKL